MKLPQMQRYPADSVQGQKAGKALANGYCGALTSLQGDMEFFAASLGLPRWSSNSFCCPLCPVKGQAPGSWRSFKLTAPWVEQCWTPQSWRSWDWEGKSTCPLFSVPGVSICSVAIDYMHCKYLGSDQTQYGGVFYLLCFHTMAGSPLQNLGQLWEDLKGLYRSLDIKHQYTFLNKLSMFVRKSGPPKLRGRAAEIKGLALPMLHLWAKHCKPELEVHRQILAMLQHNAKMEALIDEHRDENAFPAEAAKQFKDAAFGMAHLQHMVANHFYAEREDEGGIPWICNIVPKLHMLLHATLQSHCVSPRLLWCFPCEDFMHVSRTLAQNCVRGTKPLQACGKMLEHWRIGMGLQLAEQS